MALTELQREWVEALRSGKYTQGRGQLVKTRDEHTGEELETIQYCCLGVACAVLAQKGLLEKTTDSRGVWYAGASTVLPPIAQKLLGMESTSGRYRSPFPDPSYLGDGQAMFLIEDNDKHGKTFAEIADIIESEPEGLFGAPSTHPLEQIAAKY